MLRLLLLLAFCSVSSLFSQPLQDFGWTFYDTTNHCIEDNHVADIQMDKKGRIWVTTGRMSMSCFENGKWKTILARKPDSAVHGWLRKMAFMNDGTIVIAGIPGYLAFYYPESNVWKYIKTPGSIQMNSIVCNEQDIMLMGSNLGLYQYMNYNFKLLHQGYEDVMGIHLHPDGDAIAGFRRGTFRFAKKADGSYKAGILISNEAFYETMTDESGKIWATSFSALDLKYQIDTGWVSVNDIPQDIFYNFNGNWRYVAHCLAMLKDGRMVMGTQFNPSFAIKSGNLWETYTIPMNGEFDGISCIRTAADSSIWIGTWRHGVVVFSHKNDTLHKKVNRPAQPMQIPPGQIEQRMRNYPEPQNPEERRDNDGGVTTQPVKPNIRKPPVNKMRDD